MAVAAEASRTDLDEAVSPRQNAPPPSSAMDQPIRSVGAINNTLNQLDLRADPDAQATVTDFLDFTEYLPADMMRSLTLLGKLDQNYVDASAQVDQLTSRWGKLPGLPPAERTNAVELRASISENLHHAVSSRVYAHAEAQRMAENINRHYNRAKTILAKLETMLENYPPPEEQKSPVATKSPQLTRGKLPPRADGQKLRRPRVPRITVPGEVLAPYDVNFDAYTTGSESSSSESSSEDDNDANGLSSAPPQRIKLSKSSRPPKGRTPKSRTSVPNPYPGLSTSAVMAQLAPPPENATIGSADAPWGQLTAYELARLRKRMKKNAAWTPSDTMVARELSILGRGVEAFKMAKQKAEEEGKVFEGKMPVPIIDPETGEQRMPLGALTLETLASDEKNLSNRGMKLNEAKKLKRELLAKMAAEEAEESARRLDQIARSLMSDGTAQPSVPEQAAKAGGKAKTPAPKKRKRDSVPDADAEKPDLGEGQSQSQRPQFKRTKTETPVPPPLLTPSVSQPASHETPVQPPQRPAATLHSTTPIPLPVHGQDQSIAAKMAAASSAASPTGSAVGGSASSLPPVKLPPAETPIPPPIHSPKKSTTPIHPPVREMRKPVATRAHDVKDGQTLAPIKPPLSRSVSPKVEVASEADQDTAVSSPVAAMATTATTAPSSTAARRPVSRSGKAASQEPQPSVAADRPRRASTARNTPAPDRGPLVDASQQAGTGASSSTTTNQPRPSSRRAKRPAPGIITSTKSGGKSAVGTRKAAPRKKSATSSSSSSSAGGAGHRKSSKGAEAMAAELMAEEEVDDEGNVIDPSEPRYCLCNRVSFGTMIQCDNIDGCKQEWFHLDCVELEDIPARTTKWYCPECRILLNIGEKGEVSARGVKA